MPSTERKDRTRFLIEMARGALHNPTMIGKPLPCMELNEYMSTAVELFLCGLRQSVRVALTRGCSDILCHPPGRPQ